MSNAVIYWLHKQFWNIHSNNWDENLSLPTYRDGINTILDVLSLYKTTQPNLLEVGCGTGNHAAALVQQGWSVTGLDLSPKMLKRARGKIDNALSDKARFKIHNFNHTLPFGNATFDHAMCIAALQCITNKIGFFKEIRRVISTGGIFLGVFRDDSMTDNRPVDTVDDPQKGWQFILRFKRKVANTNMIQHWTRESIESQLTQNGFTIRSCEPFYKGTRLVVAVAVE